MERPVTLLDGTTWQGSIYSNGWVDGGGEPYAVVSPSTGEQLATMGRATVDDVHRAATKAVAAQRDWAAAPYNERAAVLRRAGDLWHANAEEITGWLMRETGAIGPFGGFQIMTSAEECYEAAALASAPYGELLRSMNPRLSLARRLPVGVVGVIAPFNVPDDPVHPRRRAGPRPGQRRPAQARPAHRGGRWGGAGRDLRAGRPARRSAARAARRGRRRRGAGGRARGAGDRLHRVDPGRTSRGGPGRPAPEARAPRARRELGAARPGRR